MRLEDEVEVGHRTPEHILEQLANEQTALRRQKGRNSR
jgi:hypothetical protein